VPTLMVVLGLPVADHDLSVQQRPFA